MNATPEMPKRIEIIFHDALDNIAFVKKQEWVIAGYCFAVHGAAYAICQQINFPAWFITCLSVAVVCAAGYGIVVLKGYADGLKKWRSRLSWIFDNYFTQGEKNGLKLGKRSKCTEAVFIGGLGVSLLTSALVTVVALGSEVWWSA